MSKIHILVRPRLKVEKFEAEDEILIDFRKDGGIWLDGVKVPNIVLFGRYGIYPSNNAKLVEDDKNHYLFRK